MVSYENKVQKGPYIPAEPSIEPYIKSIDSEEDYFKTIIHEFYNYLKPRHSEESVKEATGFSVRKNQGLIDFIRQIFELQKYHWLNSKIERRSY
ncbi:MAG: hypothetical protein ACOCQG_05160 [Candidatus Nanoarchaeia archaeon]